MTCEEFATAGLDLGSNGIDAQLEEAAREHLRKCPHCAALQENWLSLREDLRALAAETAGAEASPRIEMRLRQEFRTKHKTVRTRRAALVLGWGLAAAAALVLAVGWADWYFHKGASVANKTQTNPAANSGMLQTAGSMTQSNAAAPSESDNVIVASNSYGDFTPLPDSIPSAPEDATVVRVQLQRGALSALGLTVNEEHASDLIQVDLLVGDDGVPQAIRLPQTNTGVSN
jgi:hypothetical protein